MLEGDCHLNILVTIHAQMAIPDSHLVPLKPIFYQKCGVIVVFLGLEVFHFDKFFMFSCGRNAHVTFLAKPQLRIISFQNYKH